MNRRHFLERLVGFFLGLTGVSFLGPLIAYLSPVRRKTGRNILLAPDGSPMPMQVLEEKPFVIGLGIDDEPTIVIRENGELQAFSAVCTHLGCLVKWVPARREFFCPCHAGRFDANGVVIAGPPPAPLKRFRAYSTAEGYIGLEEVA